jgi:LacI family gluconate utilization system Gnt-I transcriptional repressor
VRRVGRPEPGKDRSQTENDDGIAVPEDIGVIGFNGLGLNKVQVRPITTMVTPSRDMSLIAAQALLARFNGVDVTRVTTLPCQMHPEATTRP